MNKEKNLKKKFIRIFIRIRKTCDEKEYNDASFLPTCGLHGDTCTINNCLYMKEDGDFADDFKQFFKDVFKIVIYGIGITILINIILGFIF